MELELSVSSKVPWYRWSFWVNDFTMMCRFLLLSECHAKTKDFNKIECRGGASWRPLQMKKFRSFSYFRRSVLSLPILASNCCCSSILSSCLITVGVFPHVPMVFLIFHILFLVFHIFQVCSFKLHFSFEFPSLNSPAYACVIRSPSWLVGMICTYCFLTLLNINGPNCI